MVYCVMQWAILFWATSSSSIILQSCFCCYSWWQEEQSYLYKRSQTAEDRYRCVLNLNLYCPNLNLSNPVETLCSNLVIVCVQKYFVQASLHTCTSPHVQNFLKTFTSYVKYGCNKCKVVSFVLVNGPHTCTCSCASCFIHNYPQVVGPGKCGVQQKDPSSL